MHAALTTSPTESNLDELMSAHAHLVPMISRRLSRSNGAALSARGITDADLESLVREALWTVLKTGETTDVANAVGCSARRELDNLTRINRGASGANRALGRVIRRIEKNLTADAGRAPTDSELLAAVNANRTRKLTPADLATIRQANWEGVASLDTGHQVATTDAGFDEVEIDDLGRRFVAHIALTCGTPQAQVAAALVAAAQAGEVPNQDRIQKQLGIPINRFRAYHAQIKVHFESWSAA